jgi:glycosyltransferase involved in cell wall biosynthesis
LVLVEHGPEISWGYIRHLISLACAEQVIAISASLAASLRVKFGFLLGSKRLWTIPNGVDTDFFHPGNSPQCRDLILSVATLSPVKDQATLIRACALISQNQEIRLHLAGDGVTRPHLEELSRESGTQKRVTFLGNVGRDRLVDLYRQAAVFVLSTRGEGISLAMLEAMACGLPIVASDVPGVTEILAGTGCAFLVPQGMPAEMARAIKNVLDNPELAGQMGRLARQCVTAEYSTDRMTARYREILNAI